MLLFAAIFAVGYVIMGLGGAPTWGCIMGGWVLWIVARARND